MNELSYLEKIKSDQKERRIRLYNCSNTYQFVKLWEEIRWYDKYIRFKEDIYRI
jgi:hypothetical protein